MNSETVKVIERLKVSEEVEEQIQNYQKQILLIGSAIVLKLTKACNLHGILHNCVNKNVRGSMCTSSPCGAGVEHIALGYNWMRM